jgi:hypothetical protein
VKEDITPIESACCCSGTTPESAVQHEAKNSDDSTADGVKGDDADQQEREHNQGRTAFPIALSPCERHSGNADE